MATNELFIALLITILGALGTWITKTLIPYIKSRTSASAQEAINYWVKTAVEAAEQVFAGAGKGNEKLSWVNNFLSGIGIDTNESKTKALIESAVLQLKSGVLN